MTDTITRDTPITATIDFIQYHQPALPDGDYEIMVRQVVETNETEQKTIPTTTFSPGEEPFRFTVTGPRFALQPADIQGVFPPEGSLGDHATVLPHILLNRSTLPWERLIGANSGAIPWLALLLFEADETPEPQVITLEELQNTDGFAARFPPFTLETSQSNTDQVTIIDVPYSVLQPMMPSQDDLTFLGHVRQRMDPSQEQPDDAFAVVLGNRLPRSGATHTAHLVSLENHYQNGQFNYQGAGDDDLIRLVSLKSWRFTIADPRQRFSGLLQQLDRSPGTLRLPTNETPAAEAYAAMGFIPLSHRFRQGDTLVSWYHGPLATGENTTTTVYLPAQTADALLRYDQTTGLFDVSYAAAWELGRLLALQSKPFSTSLYTWKCRQRQNNQEFERALRHLPFQQTPDSTIPETITTWLQRLSLLYGVPFDYIVPDARLLPPESIRFFQLDPLWIDSLLDGATSIGRVLPADHQFERDHLDMLMNNPHASVSGIVLRSDIVAGWPGLLVDAFDPTGTMLNLLRMDRLSANTLLCLFDGIVDNVRIHQRPEMLHFGVNPPDADHPDVYKRLRDADGQVGDNEIDPIPWRDLDRRVIDVVQMAEDIQTTLTLPTMTSAQFAFQMIEGPEEVVFERTP